MVYCTIDDKLHVFKNKKSLSEYVELLFESLDLGEISEFYVCKYTRSESKQLLAVSLNDEDNGLYREWIKIITPEGKFWTCPSAWRGRYSMPPLYDRNYNYLEYKSSMKALIKDLLKEKRR